MLEKVGFLSEWNAKKAISEAVDLFPLSAKPWGFENLVCFKWNARAQLFISFTKYLTGVIATMLEGSQSISALNS